jgi:hypothetical protein
MSKVISKLTAKQKEQIPVYIKKWVDEASVPTNRDKALSCMTQIMPERTVIFTESLQNTLDMIGFICQLCKVDRMEYDSQLSSQLNSQLRSQLYSQLDSQLYSQLSLQLYSQLDLQLYLQLRSQLDLQLGSQLDSQLRSQLDLQLGSQLDSQLDSQLRSQLDLQLRSQLDSQGIKWSYYISYYWYVWAGWYSFGEYIGVKFNTDKLTEFITILKNAPIVVFVGNLVFVCEKPTISWADGLLHNEYDCAIKWKDNTGLHYLDGVYFKKALWQSIVKQTITFGEIMAIKNTDERAVALKYNPNAMLNEDAKLVDRSERGNELWLIQDTELNKFLEEPSVWMLRMTCPTGRVFVEGVDPKVAMNNPSADYCQAVALGITPQQYGFLRNEG